MFAGQILSIFAIATLAVTAPSNPFPVKRKSLAGYKTANTTVYSTSDDTQWNLVLLVGTKSWHIGDVVSQDFETKYMRNVCSETGCDGGNPQSFKYLTSSMKYTAQGTGTITMTGNSNDNIKVIYQMLDAIETALVASSKCSTQKATKCNNNPGPSDSTKRKRDVPYSAGGCKVIEFNSCYLANYIQATMYDSDSNQKAQVTFNGASEEPEGFDCTAAMGTINRALGGIAPLQLPGIAWISGLTSLISLACMH